MGSIMSLTDSGYADPDYPTSLSKDSLKKYGGYLAITSKARAVTNHQDLMFTLKLKGRILFHQHQDMTMQLFVIKKC